MRKNTDRMLNMVDSAVAGSAPFLPVRLVVFPEFAHAAPVFPTVDELRQKLTIPIPNEHTTRLTDKAKEHDIYIQSGSMLEEDGKYPHVVFNTTCLIGPDGILFKYRKVNPWIPYEVHASPHDIPDYDEPLFPVADTPIGRIGCAICYDWLFPEVLRQLTANGAEILVRVSAYMDPWGATEPMAWWTLINRARALENLACGSPPIWTPGVPLNRWPGGPSSTEPVRSRTSRMSSRPIRAPACGTILHIRGRAGRRWSILTDGCSRTPHPDQASASSWRRLTSPPYVTNANLGSAITCPPTSAVKPMTCIGDPHTRHATWLIRWWTH